jgi:predicted solute-binding protein
MAMKSDKNKVANSILIDTTRDWSSEKVAPMTFAVLSTRTKTSAPTTISTTRFILFSVDKIKWTKRRTLTHLG